MDRWIYIISIAITVMLSGCTTMKTHPEELSSDEVSIIKGGNWGLWATLAGKPPVSLDWIDGKEITGLQNTKVSVKPGSHRLIFHSTQCITFYPAINLCSSGNGSNLTLDTEAGHNYVVLTDGSVYWIEDEKTGKIVAGNKPE